MTHSSNDEAWQHFDRIYTNFAYDPYNIRLGLCVDGFTLNNQFSKPYSCWSKFVTPYNLPPEMCREGSYATLIWTIMIFQLTGYYLDE